MKDAIRVILIDPSDDSRLTETMLVMGEQSEIRGRVNPEQVTTEYFHSMFRDLRVELKRLL